MGKLEAEEALQAEKKAAEIPVKETVKEENDIDPVEKLRTLKKLLDDGVITEEEYNEKRAKYINYL